MCLHQKLRPHRWFAEPSIVSDSSSLKMGNIYHVFMKSIVSSHQMLWSVKIGYKQLLMGKIIKQAIFFFTRISLPAVSSTTGARFLPYHHVPQEAGFRDRTSRRCCKLCRQSKHLHTYQWEKKRILLPAVSFTTSARFSVIIICNMRRRQSPMTKLVGQCARAQIL